MARLLTLLALIVALPLSGCAAPQVRNIADARTAETLLFDKAPGQGGVHALTIAGSGAIQGDAEIALRLNGTVHRTERLSGAIDFRWEGDWYADRAELRYTPGKVAGGALRLEARFHD